MTNDKWIPELGIRYQLGIDGLNLFMVALTAIAWVPCTLVACFREPDRPKLFFFNLALAETAVLGAFLAQDLALFIVFFDLMLVPFYFLIGGWGSGDRVRATTKFVIYTLVGLAADAGRRDRARRAVHARRRRTSRSRSRCSQRARRGQGTQEWIFLLFALAFLVKAPLFPLHGWVPETYRSTPIVVLALLSGVLSKVGVYGFLRIVLPIDARRRAALPGADARGRGLLDPVRVGARLLAGQRAAWWSAYSSIAQLGFIVLGIFALDDKGAQGAVFQMLNHGLVVVPLFLIIGVIAARAGGSESLSELGGMAMRAPVLAALFLIITFATLAMPGSANFVGEILVLFGTFETTSSTAWWPASGVVLAAVYMIRVFQRTMHDRRGRRPCESRELTGWTSPAIAPLVAVIVALGVYPQLRAAPQRGGDRHQDPRRAGGGAGDAPSRAVAENAERARGAAP